MTRRQVAARITWMIAAVCAVGAPAYLVSFNWAAIGIPFEQQGFEVAAIGTKVLIVLVATVWIALKYLGPVIAVLGRGDRDAAAPTGEALARARASSST